MRTTASLVAAALLAMGCYSYTGPTTGSPIEVVLAIGGEVQVNAVVRVGFLGVATDSRCPATAECVYVGDAAVVIGVSVGTGPTVADTLHTNVGPNEVVMDGYDITLLELTPYPQDFGGIPAGQYRAKLRIALLPAPLDELAR